MRPIWICGHRKCGTTLLTNLLDDHKDLVNYGSDFRLVYAMYNGYKSYGSESDLKDRFWRIFSDDRACDETINRSYIEEIVDGLNFSDRNVVWDYISKVASKISSTHRGKRIFIKETSSELYLDSITKSCEPQYVYLSRDPRDNWAAIRAGIETYYKKLGENHLESLASLINRVMLGFNAYYRYINSPNFQSSDMTALRFEDLTSAPRVTMERLCSALNIKFLETLCYPTRNGVPYSGNSHDQIKFKGVSNNSVGKYIERVPRQELALIEALCEPMMASFGYELVTSSFEQSTALEDFYAFYNQRYFFYDKYSSK